VWAVAFAGELLGLRGGLECSDWDYLRSARDGKRGALERQPTKHVHTHAHKLKPLNHFTVVPHRLSPLHFNRLWALSRGYDKGKVCQTSSRPSRQVRRRQVQGVSRTWHSRRKVQQGQALREAGIIDGGTAGMGGIKIEKLTKTNFRE